MKIVRIGDETYVRHWFRWYLVRATNRYYRIKPVRKYIRTQD